MKRSIFTVVTVALVCLATSAMATSWGRFYISNDRFGRCGDERLSPDIRAQNCVRSIKNTMLTDYGVNYTLGGLADAFLDESDYKSAIVVYDKAIKATRHSDQTVFRYLRGMSYLRWGKQDVASEEFAKIVQEANNSYGYVGLAEVAADRGDYKQAIELFDRAYNANTANYDIELQRAAVYTAMGDYDKAMKDDSDIAGYYPNFFYPFANRCWDRAVSNRDLDSALSDCNHALDILPDDPDTLDSRGMVRFRQGRLDDALADYNAALSHNPRMASALFMRGIVELRKGDAEKGEADIQQANNVYPLIGAKFAIYGIAP